MKEENGPGGPDMGRVCSLQSTHSYVTGCMVPGHDPHRKNGKWLRVSLRRATSRERTRDLPRRGGKLCLHSCDSQISVATKLFSLLRCVETRGIDNVTDHPRLERKACPLQNNASIPDFPVGTKDIHQNCCGKALLIP